VGIKSNQLLINITWEGGGCNTVDYTTVYYRQSPSNSLQNNISLYTTITSLSNDPSLKSTEIQSGDGIWGDNPEQFSQPITFSQEIEIDAVIVMSCDKNWADLTIQTPLISPQSHQARARTDPTFSFQHGDFLINSEKYVFYYISNLKVSNQSNSTLINNINYYSIYLQSKFMICNPRNFINDFGDQNFFTYQYNDLINFPSIGPFVINGSITFNVNLQDPSMSNLTTFLFEYGDISECVNSENSIGNNLNLKNNADFVYFNDSFQYPLYFFDNSWNLVNSSQTIEISFEQTVDNLTNFIDLIGRSMILRSFSVDTYIDFDENPFFISYITFSQNYQCINDAEACLGVTLKEQGLCFLINNDKFYDSFTNFIIKIVILQQNSTIENNVNLELILNLRYLKYKYISFSAILLKNEQNQLNFTIDPNQPTNFLKTETVIFPMFYEKALGNAISIYLISQNQKIQLGVCDIVLLNSSFDSSLYVETLNAQYPFIESSGNNEKFVALSLSIGVPIIILLLIGFFIFFLIN